LRTSTALSFFFLGVAAAAAGDVLRDDEQLLGVGDDFVIIRLFFC
jgi:hypothetical protein